MTHRIITGDCIEVMKTLDKVDVCIFDPPYSEWVHSKSRAGASKKAFRTGSGLLPTCAALCQWLNCSSAPEMVRRGAEFVAALAGVVGR